MWIASVCTITIDPTLVVLPSEDRQSLNYLRIIGSVTDCDAGVTVTIRCSLYPESRPVTLAATVYDSTWIADLYAADLGLLLCNKCGERLTITAECVGHPECSAELRDQVIECPPPPPCAITIDSTLRVGRSEEDRPLFLEATGTVFNCDAVSVTIQCINYPDSSFTKPATVRGSLWSIRFESGDLSTLPCNKCAERVTITAKCAAQPDCTAQLADRTIDCPPSAGRPPGSYRIGIAGDIDVSAADVGSYRVNLIGDILPVLIPVPPPLGSANGTDIFSVISGFVSFFLNLLAFLINLIMSIPIIGGILRTLLNWVREIFWRLAGIPDFILSLFGIRLPKKMYVRLIILNNNGVPITNEAAALGAITAAQTIYNNQCNINLIYRGVCIPRLTTPREALSISCDVNGFFADWGLAGTYYQFVSATCGFEDGWRSVLGYGAPIIVFVIRNVRPSDRVIITPAGTSTTTTDGCSMGPTVDYVVVDRGLAIPPNIQYGSIAHEIGHACGLPHDSGANNLMNAVAPPPPPPPNNLTNLQIAWLRNSRHCVFF